MTDPVGLGGLENDEVGSTALTDVRGREGQLYYRGYPVDELSRTRGWEEATLLLWEGELPDAARREEFRARLERRRSSLAAEALSLATLPASATPMEALRSGFSLLGKDWGYPPTEEQYETLVAFPPVFLSALARHRRGLPPLLHEPPGLPQAGAYLWRLTGERPSKRAQQALEAYLVLVADHGMNASTFVARCVLSTWSDASSALSAAVGSLKGPLHGGAPSLVADFLDQVPSPERAGEFVWARLARGERLMGFGHRVYRGEDPRARRLREIAREVADPRRLAVAEAVEQEGLRALHERRPERPWGLNVEFYAALVMESAGLPRELFSPTFALARTAGWVANLREQAGHNQLIRPRVRYVGPVPRAVPPPPA